jgi:hydrogen peroxide-dependent heme synthase
MSDLYEVPQTLEGWYVLHDRWSIDWRRWQTLPAARRQQEASELAQALTAASTAGAGRGDTAAYAIIGQKADLLFLHYRNSPDELKQAELALRGLAVNEVLQAAGSYFSVIEVSLYEASAAAARKLTDQGVAPGTPRYEELHQQEMAVQRTRLEARLRPVIPGARYCCHYPMNKRRGEQHNWYALALEERRALMRNHGRIGHKWHQQVTQVVSGAIGLDDWEWLVTLFSDDVLAFKKLITEMRFDPASSRYAEFGPFAVGVRLDPASLTRYLLEGVLPS